TTSLIKYEHKLSFALKGQLFLMQRSKRNVLFYLLATMTTTMLILVLILFYQYVYSLEDILI
ncbi:MAG: hypothetical protein ACJ71C_10550, partial [Nitrososphaeraceae archaeon]